MLRTALAFASVAMGVAATAQTYVYTPTNALSAGVIRAVPDTLLWYNSAGFFTNGPITNLGDQQPDMGNWEPYIDVLGDQVFLIGGNTFADDGTFANQRFVVTFQPVAGGSPVVGDEFFADNGAAFRQPINLSRQNGNPERIAGDRRPGATNFLAMAETSAGQTPAFQSNHRWVANAAMYTADNRYVTEQLFSLNPATLVQKPVADAWDYVYGPMAATTLPNAGNAPQLSRTGGKAVGLDNGNFAVVIDDKTGFVSSSGEVTTFSIITPAGAVVAGPTLVAPSAIWDNVAAYSGGFAVRVGSFIAFYDNAGNLTATNDVNLSSGLSFDTGRGDGARIGSDIRSHYVYMAGATPSTAQAPVSLAVFDTRTGQCIATATVSDTDPTVHKIDRVTVGVDATDHFCVVYDLIADPGVWTGTQIAARVGKLTGTNVTFITPSFYPFVNSEYDPGNVLGFVTENPSVVMTTNYICIAGKGTVNSTNNASAGPDTAPQTVLYTVINNPRGYIAAPMTAAAAGVSTVVPDMLLWYNMAGYYTNGPIHDLSQEGDTATGLGNWEPYIDVLGDSVFLIGANTFADDGTFANQRFAVTFQPVAGGNPVVGDEFFADNGVAFRQPINLSRQNGNPQRVAGDRRVGATHFVTMAETSAGQLAPFQSNHRWNANSAMYTDVNRYDTEQLFTLNPATLAQTPVADAWDYVYGPMAATTLPDGNNAPQLSRTGGKPVGLDNGNFALVIDDKTAFMGAGGEVTTFSIITPAGAVVAGPTLVAPSAIWDNVAAYSGGFAVRVGSYIAFYDNSGNLVASNNVNSSSGLAFDGGRGDGTRIGSDIRSHYVYLAGPTPSTAAAPVALAIFDGRTGQFVASSLVSDTDPTIHSIDRVTVAVDASDNFCVVYDMKPDPTIWTQNQIVARVGHFDGTNVAYLTPSFFAFVNSDSNPTNVLGFLTENPSVVMTTDYICIAGKGTVNSTNNVASGPDTAAETTLYAVIGNPAAPKQPVVLNISRASATSVTVAWNGGGTLQSTTALRGAQTVWTALPNSSPATLNVAGAATFFRVINP